MKLSEQTVMELARACRLSLTPDELAGYARDMEELEALAASLCEVDGSRADHREALRLCELRTDEARVQDRRAELLASAADVTEGYICVPRTLEDA